MLIGGFYSVDGNLLLDNSPGVDFQLRLDVDGRYGKKIYTSNGRTASVYAFRHCAERMKGKKVLLPDYLCLSVINAIEAGGVEYDFYKVKGDLEIDMHSLEEKLSDDIGMIYVIHYFSVPHSKETVNRIKEIAKERNILVMEDITQALFSVDSERMGFGDYIVASLRKWFPMTDGGLLAIRDGISGRECELLNAYDESVYKELLISVLRREYRENPSKDKAEYLEYEKRANASRYIDLSPRKMTEISEHIMTHTDIEKLIQRRIDNFEYLVNRLEKIKEIKILSKKIDSQKCFVPFGVTILVEERDKLYSYLVDNNIIPEIQWVLPLSYYSPGEDAIYMSEHNIMLQCDQRYSKEEMEYVAKKLFEFYY